MARTPDNDRWVSTGPAQRVAPARVRTLIVDDSEAVREGLTRLLGAKPFCEVLGAVSDPADALERTRAARPHVILQDFSMPGIDPLDLIRALTACRPQPAVLVLSAFVDAPAERQAALAGATGWVLKDAEPEQLYAALLGAAGVRDPGRPGGLENGTPMAVVTPPPPPPAEPEPAASLDARTVWALLRALAGDPAGLTVEGLANRAVLPLTVAARYVNRMSSRQPALVAPTGAVPGPDSDSYLLTTAGHRELERLESRIPAAQAGRGASQLH